MIHSHRPLVFAPMVFVFLLCILIWILYSEENNRAQPAVGLDREYYRGMISKA